jgi:hypothetical protein
LIALIIDAHRGNLRTEAAIRVPIAAAIPRPRRGIDAPGPAITVSNHPIADF